MSDFGKGTHMMLRKIKGRVIQASPGALVTAAFIGPGTITTCIKSGYTASYSLVSIMIIATIIAILIQYYSAKLGIITQRSLSQNIVHSISSPLMLSLSKLLIIIAIFVGNCAFEAGNFTGGALGLKMLAEANTNTPFVLLIGVCSMGLLWFGKVNWIQVVLKYMVLLMVICFFIAMVLVKPDIREVLFSLLRIDFNKNIYLIGALVGTTIGPYNIFLHSKTAAQKWHSSSDIKEMLLDTVISIGLGGVISCCIIIVAATISKSYFIQELNLNNFSQVLSAPLGYLGNKIFLLGLFAAGTSSAITSPYAAAYAVSELFDDNVTEKDNLFRSIWIIVLLIGIVIALMMGSSPTVLIIFAQYTNAIILPLIIIFLMYCINKNNEATVFTNIIFFVLIIISLLLGIRLFF